MQEMQIFLFIRTEKMWSSNVMPVLINARPIFKKKSELEVVIEQHKDIIYIL